MILTRPVRSANWIEQIHKFSEIYLFASKNYRCSSFTYIKSFIPHKSCVLCLKTYVPVQFNLLHKLAFIRITMFNYSGCISSSLVSGSSQTHTRKPYILKWISDSLSASQIIIETNLLVKSEGALESFPRQKNSQLFHWKILSYKWTFKYVVPHFLKHNCAGTRLSVLF